MQVLCRDDEDLFALQQRIRALPGVRTVRTMHEVKVHKIRFTIPPVEPEE
ncbi:hypothetical protein [Paraburkholderia terrae]